MRASKFESLKDQLLVKLAHVVFSNVTPDFTKTTKITLIFSCPTSCCTKARRRRKRRNAFKNKEVI